MFKFILVSFVLFVWFVYIYKKKKSFLTPSAFLLLLYFTSVLLSYPHVIINNVKLSLESQYFNASIVFILLLFLYLGPFVNIREDKIKAIVLPNPKIIYIFSIVIVSLSLISIIYFTPIVISVFSMSNLNIARLQVTEGVGFIEESFLNTVASVSASFFTIALFLFFIYRIKGTNKTLSFLLLISSFSYVLNVFAYVGRDGVVFWIFSFIANYGLFRNFLSEKDNKKIKRILFIFLLLAIPLFMAITFDRFSENPFSGILSYMGQSFPNFCLSFNADYPVSNGASFPLFREILGLPIVKSENIEYGGTNTWSFGTFLKSFIENFDLYGTLILGVCLGLIVLFGFKNTTKKFYFHQLFLYFLFFQVYSQGVFYFRQYTRGGNLFILSSFLFYFIFLLLEKNSKKTITLFVK